MPKLDFNVPMLDIDGEPVKQPKIDKTKTVKDPQTGAFVHPFVRETEDGPPVLEVATVAEGLKNIMKAMHDGDGSLGFGERVTAVKLARKVGDRTKGSFKNYSKEDIELIQKLSAKIGSPEFLLQLSEIIDPPEPEEQQAPASEVAA